MATYFHVRYETDGEVTSIRFSLPGAEPPTDRDVITHAAGLLFLHDCSPGEPFCVYRGFDDERIPVGIDEENGIVLNVHHYYRDSDDLWPEDERSIRFIDID
jgi:hypothetical protein